MTPNSQSIPGGGVERSLNFSPKSSTKGIRSGNKTMQNVTLAASPSPSIIDVNLIE